MIKFENKIEIITFTEKKKNSGDGIQRYFIEVYDNNLPFVFKMQFILSKYNLLLTPVIKKNGELVLGQTYFRKEKSSVVYQILYGPNINDLNMRDMFLKKFVENQEKSPSSEMKKVCNKCDVRKNEMKSCSQCKMVWYCSKYCQKDDWKEHKQNCKIKI